MNKVDRNGLTEAEFLQAYAKKNYPRPYLTVDISAIKSSKGGRYVLLVRRGQHPFLGKWALPGGFAKQDECLEQSALRELEEETGVRNAQLIPVGIFSVPGRDPRGWVVSQAYVAHFSEEDVPVRAGDDAAEAEWFQIVPDREGRRLRLISEMEQIEIPVRQQDGCFCADAHGSEGLAFDHADILLQALQTSAPAWKDPFGGVQ